MTTLPRRAAPFLFPLLVLSLFVVAAPPTSLIGSQALPAGVDVTITESGFQPSVVVVQPGQGIHWTNRAAGFQSVTANSGLFDSGNLPPGAGYSMALATPGDHNYRSSTNPSFVGTVRVTGAGGGGLSGAPTDLANNHIPQIDFPLVDPSDVSTHPALGLVGSRTRIIIAFSATATVAEANAALSAASVTLLGGLPSSGFLLVGAPDTPDFSGLDAALTSLRASPAVKLAAMSTQMQTASVPGPAEDAIATGSTGCLKPLPPPPAGPGGTTRVSCDWTWELVFDGDSPLGDGGNWGLEASRFPQAWNLLEVIRRKNASVGTAVVDDGFQFGHSDLNHLQPLVLCTLIVHTCTSSVPSSVHGNHVAGIIGADFENPATQAGRTRGVSGANPVARMYGVADRFDSLVPAGPSNVVFSLFDETLQVFDLLFGEKEAGRLDDLRVINFSIRATPADSFQRAPLQVDHANGILRQVAERAARNGVAIFQAAGNESNIATNQASFAWAAYNWTSTLPNPVIVVEAIGNQGTLPQSLQLAGFSNIGGHISAPGVQIASPVLNDDYELLDGTSMATPLVAALAGYLLAYDPTLDIPKLRAALLNSARHDTGGGAQPRLDAFASLMSLPGALRDLVNVNQEAPVPLAPNKDGNRRVFLGPSVPGTGGVETGDDVAFARTPGTFSDPDGRIDMRDFRRFRDAWLQVCKLLPSSDPGCPAPENIVLNGADDHPKKDLNFDSCVNTTNQPTNASCPTREHVYSRFDFNGDGRISSNERTTVPGLGQVTDLEVLASQWSPGPDYQEGWAASNLDRLLISGDLELRADDFFTAGADQVEIQVIRKDPAGDEEGPTRILRRDEPGQFIVVTVPVALAGSPQIEIRASARIGSDQVRAIPRVGTLKPGEDKRVDLCRVRLDLSSSATALPSDGAAQAAITATAADCIAGPLDQQQIRFTMTPSGPGHASLSVANGQTSADGKVTTTFTAGTTPATYTITASMDIGNGQQVTASLQMQTTAPLQIAYVWEQTNVSWTEGGTTRWPSHPPTMPDCDEPPVSGYIGYCIESSQVQLVPGNPLRREGVLSGTGNSMRLSEQIVQSAGAAAQNWSLTNPDGSNPRSGSGQSSWRVAEAARQQYQNYPLPSTVTVDDQSVGITLSGLKAVAELPYPNIVEETQSGAPRIRELPSTVNYLRIEPRGNGSALQYAANADEALFFRRQADGSFEPYRFCLTLHVDRTGNFGYLVERTDPSTGLVIVERKTTFAPGDRPMPVGSGDLQLRFAFAAVAAYGSTVPIVTLPDCSANTPPTPSFTFTPDLPDEGGVIQFTDRSTDPDHDIVSWRWDFGDGTTSAERHPYHLYHDSGVFSVVLTVTDSRAAQASTTQQIVVRNLPPEVQLGNATAPQGSGLQLPYQVRDPAVGDLQTLSWVLTSSTPSIQPVHGSGVAFGVFNVDVLPPGTYTFTLTATDKDGGTATATATGTVLAGPAPTATAVPPPVFFPTCDPVVVWDAEERRFLDLINSYRASYGLAPALIASPALTRAAERHSRDMAANNYDFRTLPSAATHIGSDGSTTQDRVQATGYPGTFGENLAQMELATGGTAATALFTWQISNTGHNENQLNPAWRAVGLAREQTATSWYWTAIYGNVVDCPTAQVSPATDLAVHAASLGAETQINGAPSSGVDLRGLPSALIDPAMRFFSTVATTVDGLLSPRVAAAAPLLQELTATLTATLTPTPSATRSPTTAATLPAGPTSTGTATATASATLAASTASTTTQVPTQTGAPPSTGLAPVAAFSVSQVSPSAGAIVTFANLSRDASARPIAATLEFGDGSPAASLNSGASTQHTFAATGTFTVTLTATDAAGVRMTVSRALTVVGAPTATPGPTLGAGDFTIALAPASQVLAPGGTTTYTVILGSLNGFSAPVALSVTGLPSGVTGSFGSTSVTPSGAAILTLTAASGAATGPFELTVTGVGGGQTHTTLSTVTLNFGLIPACFGAFAGTVTDAATGAPIAGATVTGFGVNAITDAAGRYTRTGLALGPNNEPAFYPGVKAQAAGYHDSAGLTPQASCGVVTIVDFALTRQLFGSISGGVFIGIPDPNDTSATRAISNSGTPIPNVVVSISSDETSSSAVPVSGPDGSYASGPLGLRAPSNAPANYTINVTRFAGQASDFTEYWFLRRNNVVVQANQNTTLDLLLVPKCTGTITGTVTFGDTGQPAAGLNVNITDGGSFGGPFSVTTDSSGRYSSPVLLATNNSSTQVFINASSPNYQTASRSIPLARCGDIINGDLTLVRLGTNVGTVQGHVYDSETGLPLAGARVRIIGPGPSVALDTGADGAYAAQVGLGPLTSGFVSVYVEVDRLSVPYWVPGPASFTLQANQTVTQDFRVLRQHFGRLAGTVRDEATGLPIAGAFLLFPNVGPSATADANGAYLSDPLPASPGTNQPRVITVVVSPPGPAGRYWTKQVEATIVADETTFLDVLLLPVCAPATIVGSVQSAVTGQPIAGATIRHSLSNLNFFTDANGRFTLPDLPLGSGNAPVLVAVTASAPGFLTQQKTVTIYCGGTIVLDFGGQSTATGTIQGTVTNRDTGQPMLGVFIGSEFGGSAFTNAQGQYTLTNVPLGTNDADRVWQVIADPDDLPAQTKSVTAHANTVVTLNFEFSPAATPTITPTRTVTPTSTTTVPPSVTTTQTPTSTLEATGTPTASATVTATATLTATSTPSSTATVTPTASPTATLTATRTATATASPTASATLAATVSSTATASQTPPPSDTPTRTPTATDLPTATATYTPTRTATNTPVPTETRTPTATLASTATPTVTPTITQTVVPTSTLTPTATPGTTPALPFNMLVLHPSLCGSATFAGNGTLRFVDGVMVDSECDTALRAIGNAQVEAEALDVTGGFSMIGSARFNPTPRTGVMPLPDPLAALPAPTGDGMQRFSAVRCTNQTRTLAPGIYPSIAVSANCTLIMQPGTYVLAGGGLTVTANGSLRGTDVTLYNTRGSFPGAGGQMGSVSFTGTGVVQLTPPGAGTYAGILLFQDRTNTRPFTISGTAALAGIRGTIYGPVMPVEITGNGTTGIQLIVESVTITGNGDLTFDPAQPSANDSAIELQAALMGRLDELWSFVGTITRRLSG